MVKRNRAHPDLHIQIQSNVFIVQNYYKFSSLPSVAQLIWAHSQRFADADVHHIGFLISFAVAEFVEYIINLYKHKI